ncbi:GntR family transcriptional regulator [Ruegeria sp. 2012CJ41-6]|uniref:GntR family transcriptional regulator n=1 Tax=Ruegeria spongiae TaxID=2942209 RepID=A0ABT0Q630_9RHOB|nr:UTRA domain-containing protein [Ruegeria spongiae]MCL6284852.1 GntR family transcriptional regulator [Ruegeria spongiae]
MADRKTISYQDIRDEVVARIQNRRWPQGTVLPTELELAAEFGCARATVNRALRELAERGIVDRKRKSGTRVALSPTKQAKLEIAVVRQTVEEMNAAYRYSLVSRDLMACPPWLQAKIGLTDPGQVLHLCCMHFADDRPFQFEERWINVQAVPHVIEADFLSVGPNEWLLAEVPFSDAEVAFSAVPASASLSEFLAVPTGTPLFQMERTTWFRSEPVTFVRMTFHQGYQMRTRY